MANFFIIVDPDPERRLKFQKIIEPLLPPVTGLITNSSAIGDFSATWAAYKSAPLSWVTSQEGAAVVWGEAIVQQESTRIDATNLREIWQKSSHQSLPPFDGYYAAVVYHPDNGLIVAADILGLFPLYYYTHGEVALIASSPELFQYHPLFKAKFNPPGLVGILLTNGLVDGQTLWQGVRRLSAGHFLLWQSSKPPQEVKQYEIPGGSEQDSYSDLSFKEHLDILEQVLDQALKRHLPKDQQYSLLLSGGLDSRTLAGFLHRQGIKPIALTLGKRSDLEMQCATPVARTLGLEHHTTEIPFEQYSAYAELMIKWEHLANGFNGMMFWGVYPYLRQLDARFISGYSMGPVFGQSLLPSENESFEQFFSSINAWGLSPDLLNKLLRQEVFGDAVEDTLTHLKREYEGYSTVKSKRAWYFDLYHRQRFHTGILWWQQSFGAWPVLPILDSQVLETNALLPTKTLIDRRAQQALLCTRFPQLAKLPLDRNNYNIEPLQFGASDRYLAPWLRLQRKWRRWQQKLGYERRYYYRILDVNNSGFRQVRQQADLYRQQVQYLFNAEVFDQLLPTSEVNLQYSRDSIIEASRTKALLGFLLWSRNHL
ncbi:asparagine synthase-related protein [Lyngbya aestuarii]|uniref:asparagine synthase-related protein n=1 Tax=Lyngbya aestuarii TaxID=118322 RepID=UPI00403DC2B4